MEIKINRAIAKRLEVITRGLVSSLFAGRFTGRYRGRGLEFEDYVDYNYGDDARFIDWKASLKANKLLIKRFSEEKRVSVFFLFDTSSSMVFGSIDKLKFHYAAELIATISYVIISDGDEVGLALFNDKVVKDLPLNTGEGHFNNILNILSNMNFYGGGCNIIEGIKFLLNHLEKGTVVVIVSDFIGLKGEWIKYLKMAAKKFDLIGIMIRDPRDRYLPLGIGQIMVSDTFSNKQLVIDPKIIKKQFEDYVREQEREIQQIFYGSNSGILNLSSDQSFVYPLIKFFKNREKRWR